jgi:hypothetical protein
MVMSVRVASAGGVTEGIAEGEPESDLYAAYKPVEMTRARTRPIHSERGEHFANRTLTDFLAGSIGVVKWN